MNKSDTTVTRDTIKAGETWIAQTRGYGGAWDEGDEVVTEPDGYLKFPNPTEGYVAFKVKGDSNTLEISLASFLRQFARQV